MMRPQGDAGDHTDAGSTGIPTEGADASADQSGATAGARPGATADATTGANAGPNAGVQVGAQAGGKTGAQVGVNEPAGLKVNEPAGLPAADPDAVSRFVEAFASQLVEAGLARMPARVFSALLASEDGVLTSAELSARLQVSPAGISGAVRYLSQVAMIDREREPGSRRERYRLHHDQWYEMLADRQTLLRRWELTLREGVATLGPESRPGQRIAETVEFFVYMKTELAAMIERWRKHREELFGTD